MDLPIAELRQELKDLTRQQVSHAQEQVALSVAFEEHRAQNRIDFDQVDADVLRVAATAKERSAEILAEVRALRQDFEVTRQLVYKFAGALIVLIPILNHVLETFILR